MKYAILNEDKTAVREFKDFDVLPPHKPGFVLPVFDGVKPTPGQYEDLVPTDFTIEEDQVVQNYGVEPWSEARIWDAVQSAGWTDPVTGIKLKTTQSAQQLFVSGMVLWQAVLSAGYAQPTDTTTIWDYNEQPQVLSYADAMGLVIRYGVAWAQLYAEYAP